MQIILRLFLAIIHVFCDLIYWSRVQWKSWTGVLFSDKNKSADADFLIKSIEGIRNLPRHLTVILGHEEVSFFDLVRIVSWCVIAGIPYVSFYDHNGFLQKNEKVIEKKLKSIRPDLEQKIVWNSQSSAKSNKNGINGVKFKTRVQLLSYEDGKGKIVSLAQNLAKAVTSGALSTDEISIELLRDKLQLEGIPNPDLAIICGHTCSTYGFLPWHIKITEFVQIPSHHNILVKDFAELLKKYSKCNQRHGK